MEPEVNIVKKEYRSDTPFEFEIDYTLSFPIGIKMNAVTAWAKANLLEGVNPSVYGVEFVRHEYDKSFNLWRLTVGGDHQRGGEDHHAY